MALNITELKQKRQEAVVALRKLNDETIERNVETAEEREKFDEMEADIRSIERLIEREERLVALEAEQAKSQLDKQPKTSESRWHDLRYGSLDGHRAPSRAELERRASHFLQGWLMRGKPESAQLITDEHHSAAKFFGCSLDDKEIPIPITKDYRQLKREFRNLDVANATKGQETIPEGFVNSLEMSLLTFGGMRQVADVIRTDSGNDLPWPTVNDTANKGELLTEATTFGNSVDPVFGSVTFKAWKYSSKAVILSTEILQDSAFDLGARIGEMLAIRIGRIQNEHFTTGGGTTLPRGVIVAAGTTAALDNTSITGDDFINLEHSLDPAYRSGAMFMMHDLILAAARKLKESTTGNYIWQPGLQAGVPDRLLGYRYQINQQMSSTIGNSEKVVAFGDMSKYKIRDVATIRLRRLDELYAQSDQVGFVAFMRSDGNLLDAGTDPVKVLTLLPS